MSESKAIGFRGEKSHNLYNSLTPHGRLRFLTLLALLERIRSLQVASEQVFFPNLVYADLFGRMSESVKLPHEYQLTIQFSDVNASSVDWN